MTTFLFDYDIFYKYYTDPANYFIDNSSNRVWYYYNEASLNQKPRTNILSKNYILIKNEKLYITATSAGGLFFTIPEFINGKLWDFHYHFVLSNILKNGNYLIAFHKTIQNPIQNGKERFNCFFENKKDVKEVSELICEQTMRKNKMKDVFSPSESDYAFIEEIISRPFLGVRCGGKKSNNTIKKYRKTKKSNTKHRRSKNKTISKK